MPSGGAATMEKERTLEDMGVVPKGKGHIGSRSSFDQRIHDKMSDVQPGKSDMEVTQSRMNGVPFEPAAPIDPTAKPNSYVAPGYQSSIPFGPQPAPAQAPAPRANYSSGFNPKITVQNIGGAFGAGKEAASKV